MGNTLKPILLPSSSIMTTKPVTFILGATGTGKTELSIALAKKFNGEVINADAMQIYKGLDIVTNKVTVEEQDGVPHHLLDLLDSESLSFTIHDFKRQATATIDSLLSAGKLPIIVGGTNYYLDSLLWNSLIPKHEPDTGPSHRFIPAENLPSPVTASFLIISPSEEVSQDVSQEVSHDMSQDVSQDVLRCSDDEIIQGLDTNYLRLHIDKVDSRKLHSLLMRVDKETAKTMHPNTARKVIRALEVIKQHGKTQSEFLAQINKKAGDQSFGAELTYKNSVAIWLQCDSDVLDERLNSRVEKMVERGLIAELDSFHVQHNESLLSRSSAEGHGNYTRGIFQCIGFKEFNDFLLLSSGERKSERGLQLFNEGLSAMKAATRRYAKYQNKWVRKQFFEERNPGFVPPVYSFDSSERSKYMQSVVEPCIELLGEIIRGDVPTQPKYRLETKPKADNRVVYKTCEACGVTCIRLCEWESHIKSRKHHKRLSSLRKSKLRLAKARSELLTTLTVHENSLKTSECEEVIGSEGHA